MSDTSHNNLWVYLPAEEIFAQSRKERAEKGRGNPLLLGGFARALLFYDEKFS
jgi:hypothetical protein